MKLAGKTAIITGAGSGIGHETARLFGSEGAFVQVVDINIEAARAVADQIIQEGGRAQAWQANVAHEQDVAALMDAVAAQSGLDILVNNAGFGIAGTAVTTELTEFQKIMSVNVEGVFLCSKYALPHMLKRSAGVIVNTASIAGLVGLRDRVAYCASKGAVVAMTRAMALDHVQSGIRINAVAPGTVESPYFKEIYARAPDPQALRAQYAARQPMNRLGTPTEIARAILFLASEDSSFATGSVLTIDGGLTAA